jgi:hypothetical protein
VTKVRGHRDRERCVAGHLRLPPDEEVVVTALQDLAAFYGAIASMGMAGRRTIRR